MEKQGGEHIPRLFPTTFVYAAKFVHTVILPLTRHCFTYGSISPSLELILAKNRADSHLKAQVIYVNT